MDIENTLDPTNPVDYTIVASADGNSSSYSIMGTRDPVRSHMSRPGGSSRYANLYQAVVDGLEALMQSALGVPSVMAVEVIVDDPLVLDQLQGRLRVVEPGLKSYYDRAIKLAMSFEFVRFSRPVFPSSLATDLSVALTETILEP